MKYLQQRIGTRLHHHQSHSLLSHQPNTFSHLFQSFRNQHVSQKNGKGEHCIILKQKISLYKKEKERRWRRRWKGDKQPRRTAVICGTIIVAGHTFSGRDVGEERRRGFHISYGKGRKMVGFRWTNIVKQ